MSSYFLLKYLSVIKNHLYSFLFQLLNKWMYKKSCKDVSFCFETLNINKIWNTNSNDLQKVNKKWMGACICLSRWPNTADYSVVLLHRQQGHRLLTRQATQQLNPDQWRPAKHPHTTNAAVWHSWAEPGAELMFGPQRQRDVDKRSVISDNI